MTWSKRETKTERIDSGREIDGWIDRLDRMYRLDGIDWIA